MGVTGDAFLTWQQALFALADERRLREALELLASPPPHLSAAQRTRADFWTACLHASLDEANAALSALEGIQARGEWMAPVWLERMPELQPLREHPRFVRVLDAWQARLKEEEAAHRPALTRLEPRGGARGTLVALHGNANTPDTIRPQYADLTAEGWEVALPGSGQYAGPEALVWDDAERAQADVRAWARELDGRPVWAGFSSGGRVALNAVLSGLVPACGVLAVAPSLPADLTFERPAPVPIALFLGESDGLTPRAQAFAGTLRVAGVPVRVWTHPGGHTHPHNWPEVRAEALAWLAETARSDGQTV